MYEPRAITWEKAARHWRVNGGDAFAWQQAVFKAIGRLKGMLNPMRGFAAFQYISHKVLRWLSPFFMIAAFGANLGLLEQPFYQWTMLAQVVFYSLAALGFVLAQLNLRFWPVQIPFYFCFANATSLAGFWRWVTKSQPVTWVKAR